MEGGLQGADGVGKLGVRVPTQSKSKPKKKKKDTVVTEKCIQETPPAADQLVPIRTDFFFFSFGPTGSMQKFLDQGLNLCHSSDNAGSLALGHQGTPRTDFFPSHLSLDLRVESR